MYIMKTPKTRVRVTITRDQRLIIVTQHECGCTPNNITEHTGIKLRTSGIKLRFLQVLVVSSNNS